MMYIDSKTFEVIGDISDARISGALFECDELLAPTISILNKLGFTTEFCCSGHAYTYKEKGKLTPYWRDAHCYICFTKDLEEMEKKGFVVPKGFQIIKSDDYFDVVEDGEVPWKLQIFKNFDTNESPFLQVLDNAKVLYTWACAMAYARNKEWEAKKKLIDEIMIQINMPKPSEQTVFAPDDRLFTKIKFHDNTLDEDVTVTIKDYVDFLNGVRASFKEAIGEDIFDLPFRLEKKDRPAVRLGKDERCIFCGLCARKCPQNAITVVRNEKRWEVNDRRCLECGLCVDVCPKHCLSLDHPLD